MPIKIGNINPDQPTTIKKAIEDLARNGQSLQKPSEGDNLFVTVVPQISDVSEGQLVFHFDGGTTYRMYVKINGQMKYIQLTNV